MCFLCVKIHFLDKKVWLIHKKAVPLQPQTRNLHWKDGGVVDRGGLENR